MAGRPLPRTDLERAIASIWARVLDRANIYRDDHFFSIGGNSMSALRVALTAEEDGLTLRVRDLFLHPVLADLAAAAQPAAPRSCGPVGDADDSSYPALRMQVGMVFEAERNHDRSVYQVVTETTLARPCPPSSTLVAALRQVVDAQPGLRTCFDFENADGPRQQVRDLGELPVRCDDLSGLPADQADDRESEIRAEERRHRFERDDFPLWRLRCVARPGEETHLFLTHHHAVLDGWSVALFFDHLRLALSGQDIPHASGVNRAAAAAEAAALESPDAERFWADLVQTWTAMPVPRRDPARTDPPLWSLSHPMSDRVRSRVERGCSTSRVSPRQLFLAVHLHALELYGIDGPTPDALVVVNARPEVADADLALGVFLNAVPVRALKPGASWSQRLDDIAAQEASLQPHRHFPFAEMRRRFGMPAPTTWFTFTDFAGTSLGRFLHTVVDHNVTELPATISVVDDGIVVDGSADHFTRAQVNDLLQTHLDSLDAALHAIESRDDV